MSTCCDVLIVPGSRLLFVLLFKLSLSNKNTEILAATSYRQFQALCATMQLRFKKLQTSFWTMYVSCTIEELMDWILLAGLSWSSRTSGNTTIWRHCPCCQSSSEWWLLALGWKRICRHCWTPPHHSFHGRPIHLWPNISSNGFSTIYPTVWMAFHQQECL